jgi:hypothetical protein
VGVFRMREARAPNRSVDNVSSMWQSAVAQVMSKWVLALPPSDDCSSRVSLLSRYGTCDGLLLLLELLAVSAWITFPSADSDYTNTIRFALGTPPC